MHRPENHLPYLLLFLKAVEKIRQADGAETAVTIPNQAFVLREDDKHFWELLAFKVRGVPSLLVGGVRFRRQEAARYSRQSLVSFLSASTREVNLHETPVPPHLVEVMVSNSRESIHDFLKGCRQGTDYPVIKVDKQDIRFAFDFRLANPSRSHRRDGAPVSEELHLFRTEEGHVISAVPHQLPSKLHRKEEFIALTQPTQHTACSDLPLPTLVAHRQYLVMTGKVEDSLQPWLYSSMPFHVELANSSHVLDPELESYRAYRSREVRDSERDSPQQHPAALAETA